MRKVSVIRDGKVNSQLSHFDLLVGDILILNTGDILPIDGIVT
jgi:magnesium-transporting ATPase (P-type)